MEEFGPQYVLTARCYIIVSPADTLVSLILDPEHKSCQPGQRLGGGLTLSAKHSHIFQQMGYEFDVVEVVYVWVGGFDIMSLTQAGWQNPGCWRMQRKWGCTDSSMPLPIFYSKKKLKWHSWTNGPIFCLCWFPSNLESDENTDISFIPVYLVAQGHDDLNSTRSHNVICVWISYLGEEETGRSAAIGTRSDGGKPHLEVVWHTVIRCDLRVVMQIITGRLARVLMLRR